MIVMIHPAFEIQREVYIIGVTDGLTAWLVQFSRSYVAAMQWVFSPTFEGPLEDLGLSPYVFNHVNNLDTHVDMSFTLKRRHLNNVADVRVRRGAFDTSNVSTSAAAPGRANAVGGALRLVGAGPRAASASVCIQVVQCCCSACIATVVEPV